MTATDVRPPLVKATIGHGVIAESRDIVECAGYLYFPRDAVRTEWLRKVTKTAKDLECPHGVQFYDVVIDGVVHERNAWCYEAPLASKKQTAGRIGFWKDVKLR